MTHALAEDDLGPVGLPPELVLDEEPIDPDTLDEWAANDAPWRIDNDDLAEWAGRKLDAEEREIAKLEDQAGRYRRKIGEWFENASKPHHRRAAWLRQQLAGYGIRQRAAKRLTVDLPSVVVRTKSNPPTYEIDAELALDWAEKNAPELVERQLNTAALRKMMKVAQVRTGRYRVEFGCGCVASLETLEDLAHACPESIHPKGDVIGAKVTDEMRMVPVIAATGEVVQGVMVVPHEDSASVKVRS